MQVNLNQIVASDKPIRTTWSEEEMEQLVDSIKQWGVIQAVKLRPSGMMRSEHDGNDVEIYEIVDGHRRVEASRRVGLEYIEALNEDMDDQTASVQSLIGNVQREDMNAVDIGYALKELKDMTGWANDEICKKCSKSLNWVSTHLSLTHEPIEVQRLVSESNAALLSAEHVVRIKPAGLSDNDKIAVLQKAADEEISRQNTRKIAEAVKVADELGDQRAKEALIAEPYSPLMHDPEIVKERHERYAKTNVPDPMYIRTDKERKSFAQKQQSEWERLPEAKTVLNYINKWHDETVPNFIKAAVIGKLSPEGKRFLARRVARLSTQLTNWQHQLESEETNGR